MKLYISFGEFELKYFFYCILFSIVDFGIVFFYSYDKQKSNIFGQHKLFIPFLYYLGYLFNVIPLWITQIKSKAKKDSIIKDLEIDDNLSITNKSYGEYFSNLNYLKLCPLILLLLLIDSIYIALNLINKNKDANEDEYLVFLIIFLAYYLFKETYYKHHIISIIAFISTEYIKNIFLTIKHQKSKNPNFYVISFLEIIKPILLSIYFIYLKDFMDKKFISPYKYNFFVGLINAPLTIIIYFIFSFTIFGKKIDNSYYCDNIFELMKDIKELDRIYLFLLIIFLFSCVIYSILLNKTIYDFSLYHIYIPFLVEQFMKGIINESKDKTVIISLISSFFIEIIMMLIFLEKIEINFCGLNENLKKNIISKGSFDNSLNNEDDENYKINKKYSIN